jgi:hypothetical protein
VAAEQTRKRRPLSVGSLGRYASEHSALQRDGDEVMLPVVAAVLVAAGLLMSVKPHRVRAEYMKMQYARPGWLHWLYDYMAKRLSVRRMLGRSAV